MGVCLCEYEKRCAEKNETILVSLELIKKVIVSFNDAIAIGAASIARSVMRLLLRNLNLAT